MREPVGFLGDQAAGNQSYWFSSGTVWQSFRWGGAVILIPMRLLIDQPNDGVSNMARDEALLMLVGKREAPPTLRFYRWDPPTISLGYFQHYSEYESLLLPAGGLPVVRRTTGGGAILHDREWTYSLTLPIGHSLVNHGGAQRLYEIVHEALVETLLLLNVKTSRCGFSDGSSANKGPFFCFDRRHEQDVVISGMKLAGSAQRRTRFAILQHGSIVLANRFDQHRVGAIRDFVDLDDDSLLDPLIAALTRGLGASLDCGEWTSVELELADSLREKYASETWTKKY